MKRLMWLLLSAMAVAQSTPAPTFSDDFDLGHLDTNKWTIATYKSPDSHPDINDGQYIPEALDFSHGMLAITSDQPRMHSGHRGSAQPSYGGAIISKALFGFGTYEIVMRMSSTAATPDGKGVARSGSVSSGFLYNKNSETEIDLEFLGNENAIWITTWHNKHPNDVPRLSDNIRDETKIDNEHLSDTFHTYRIEWKPKEVKVYIDDTLVSDHKHHVPSSPAHIILQHRGTNSEKWGGEADNNATHYFYVKSVSFTPAQ